MTDGDDIRARNISGRESSMSHHPAGCVDSSACIDDRVLLAGNPTSVVVWVDFSRSRHRGLQTRWRYGEGVEFDSHRTDAVSRRVDELAFPITWHRWDVIKLPHDHHIAEELWMRERWKYLNGHPRTCTCVGCAERNARNRATVWDY